MECPERPKVISRRMLGNDVKENSFNEDKRYYDDYQ
jgi:hypothetical protein